MKLEEVEQFLLRGNNIEEFVERIDWKEFEKFVREIFSVNKFETFSNFRFRTKRRFEVDIVAAKNDFIFVVDCKEWDRGRNKNSGLKKAAEEQIERACEFQTFLSRNPIAQSRFRVDSNAKIIPILVTWYEETISEHERCYIIPVWKLNSYLINHDFY
jgi:Holliday junction resolvase-like predicted endonuclease